MSASVNSRPARHPWLRRNVRFDDIGVRFPDIRPEPTCSKHRTLLKNRPGAATRNVAREATARTQPADAIVPTAPRAAERKSRGIATLDRRRIEVARLKVIIRNPLSPLIDAYDLNILAMRSRLAGIVRVPRISAVWPESRTAKRRPSPGP
jgi:hypothetical protein